MSCSVGWVLFRLGVLIHAHAFVVLAFSPAVEAPLYIAASGFGLTQCTLLFIYSLSDDVAEQDWQRVGRRT
jgi:hypothetical protein